MARTDAPSGTAFVVGSDDDLDGVTITVVGEDFPRVSITSAGVAVGDGTDDPVAVPADVQDQLDALDARVTALEP